jgi:hypothetical protein
VRSPGSLWAGHRAGQPRERRTEVSARRRGSRRSAAQLRIEAIRTIVTLDQDALTIRALPSELAGALEHLGTAAMLMARHIKLDNVHPWAMVNACTHGRLLTAALAG